MKGNKGGERRACPRVDRVLPLRLNARGFDISASTRNLSCIGAYCRVNGYLPVLTKLNIVLVIGRQISVKCRGVVVRVDNIDESSGYNIAIYFNEISERDKDKIEDAIRNGYVRDDRGGHIR